MSSAPQPSIKTDRLLLRPARPEDAADIFEFMSIPSVSRYTTRLPFTEIEQAETFLASRSGPDTYNFAVVLPSPSEPLQSGGVDGKVIGLLGSHNFPLVGYLFHPGYGKKGYATEALNAFIQAFFEHVPSPSSVPASGLDTGVQGYDYLEAYVDVDNAPSMKLLERCGFVIVERRDNAYTNPLLGSRSDHVFQLARPGMKLEDVFGHLKAQEDSAPPVPDIM